MRNTVEGFTEIQLNYISLRLCIYGYPEGIEVIVGEFTDSCENQTAKPQSTSQ